MAEKIVIENDFSKEFSKVIDDIANINGVKKTQQGNSEMALKQNFEMFIENFNNAKNLSVLNETYIKKIFDFCTTTKAKLKLDNLSQIQESNMFLRMEFDIKSSRLAAFLTYFIQSAAYIESLSDDMRFYALEEGDTKILNILCASTQFDGVFYKNFYDIVNKKCAEIGRNAHDYSKDRLLDHAIGIYIAQMFFVIEQFSFLAAYFHKNGNFAKYDEYLKKATLTFHQMKSQLVGKRNFINAAAFKKDYLDHVLVWQTILEKVDFPDFCEGSHKCYDMANNTRQLTALHIAAFRCDFDVIQATLHSNGNDVNISDQDGFTALHCATLAETSVVECFMAHMYLDVNAQSKAGLTALHIAVIRNSIEVVQILLNHPKIDVNVAAMNGWTALHIAVALQNEEIVEELLKISNISVNAKMCGELNPLHIAIRLDNSNLIEMLLKQDAEIEALTETGLTVWQIAEKFNCSHALNSITNFQLKTLEANNATSTTIDSINVSTTLETPKTAPSYNAESFGETIAKLQQTIEETSNRTYNLVEESKVPAASQSKSAIVSGIETESSCENNVFEQRKSTMIATLLKQLGAAAGNNLTTQLFLAILKGQLESIKSLVTAGVDITKIHESGKNVLELTILNGNLAIFKYFLKEHSLATSKRNVTLEYLLFNAAEQGAFKILKYLIEFENLSPQLLNIKKKTLLCTAIAGGNFTVVKYLVEDQGVPITSTTENCPLCAAIEIDHFQMFNYLLSNGANILGVCDQQRPILVAAEKASLNIFKTLLELGADINVKLHKKGVFDFAAIAANLDVLKYLIEEKNYEPNTTIVDSGLSTFFQVIRAGCFESIKYFTEVQKCSIFESGPLNGTILHEVAFNRNLFIIKLFVEKLAFNVKARDSNGFIPLFYAAQCNNLSAVKYFVKKRKLGIHLKDPQCRTILHIAAMNGQLDVVQYLVEEQKANLNIKDIEGLTPLHLAAQNTNNFHVLEYLLNQGSDKNDFNANKMQISNFVLRMQNIEIIEMMLKESKTNANHFSCQNTLFYAIQAGQLEAVKYLVNNRKVDIHYKDDFNKTAIHVAVEYDHLDITKYLVEVTKVNLNVRNNFGLNPLFVCVQMKSNIKLFKYLLNQGSDVIWSTAQNTSILHFAAKIGNANIVKFLFEEESLKPDIITSNGETPFLYAVQAGRLDVVQLFYTYNNQDPNIIIENSSKKSALHIAAECGYLDLTKYLVEVKKANLNIKDNDGLTPLFLSAKKGNNIELFKYLLNQGSDILWLIPEKSNILHFAAKESYVDILHILIEEFGIKADTKNVAGNTPLMHAAFHGNLSAVKYLVNLNKTDIDNTNNRNRTALFWAVQGKDLDIVRFLVEWGANIQHQDMYKKLPLDYAKGDIKTYLKNL